MDRVFSPLFDVGIPAVAIFVGLTWAGVVFVAELLFEALILWRWLKFSWWRALVYSLLMNVTSTIAGIVLTWFFLSWFTGWGFFVLYVVWRERMALSEYAGIITSAFFFSRWRRCCWNWL